MNKMSRQGMRGFPEYEEEDDDRLRQEMRGFYEYEDEEEEEVEVKVKVKGKEEIYEKKSEDEENYSEFDLLDEQMVASIQQFKMNDTAENFSGPIRYGSIASLDQSQWYLLC